MGLKGGVMSRKPIEVSRDRESYPRMSEGTTVEVKMAPAFARILESVFNVDPWADYCRLEEGLKVGSRGLSDVATLREARDAAEDNARLAHNVYCAARVEQERYELDAKVIEGVARRKAVRDLTEEKESGQRKKQITEADIEGQMLLEFPDEYKSLTLNRLKLRKMVESMELLCTLWQSRCRALDTLLGKTR